MHLLDEVEALGFCVAHPPLEPLDLGEQTIPKPLGQGEVRARLLQLGDRAAEDRLECCVDVRSRSWRWAQSLRRTLGRP